MFGESNKNLSWAITGALISAMAFSGFAAFEGKKETEMPDNEVRIQENNKCLAAHMLPELDRNNKVICTPDPGKIRIRQYFDYLYAEQVIRDKTGKPLPEKFKPGEKNNMPLNPNSFETKVKRTE